MTLTEAKAYLNRHMTRAARRGYGREQQATVQGADGTVLANLSGLSRSVPSQETASASPRDAIIEVQRLLSAAGYDTGPADGELGPRTQNAIVRYQATRGLRVDGQVSQQLLENLRETVQ